LGSLTQAVSHELRLAAGIRSTRDAKDIRAMTDFADFLLVPETGAERLLVERFSPE
jgi:hypothetical protein